MESTGLTKMGCPPRVYNGDRFEFSRHKRHARNSPSNAKVHKGPQVSFAQQISLVLT
jgi:hypothetical protein